jgi:tryptophan synthase beta subunit
MDLYPFLSDDVELIGVEAGVKVETGRHSAHACAETQVCCDTLSYLLQDEHGQASTHSISAGLDTGVGPEHAMLRDSQRLPTLQ